MDLEAVGTVIASLAVAWGTMREQVRELRTRVDRLDQEREARAALELKLGIALERWDSIDTRLDRIEKAVLRVVPPRARRDDPR
jgi:hypothetical protein